MRSRPLPVSRLSPLCVLLSGVFCTLAHADSFTVTAGQTVTTSQTLDTNETGVIDAGGKISLIGTAVDMLGANSSLTNNGEIYVSADFADGTSGVGISNIDNNSTVVNNGSIVANGGAVNGGEDAFVSDAVGIYSFSKVINSGEILVNNALSGVGVLLADGAAAINSGSIVTSGDGTWGIGAGGLVGSITNSGLINTSGNWAHGIFVYSVPSWYSFPQLVSDDVVFTNSGAITTTGDEAYGIQVEGLDGGKIVNSGTIVASGEAGRGISYSGGSGSTITHSGVISVSGAGAIGIHSDGTDGTLNISGRIVTTGAATSAIIGDNNQTLNLLPGAQIIGTVDLGSGTNQVNVLLDGAGRSATLTVDNAGTISQRGQGLSLVSDNTIAIIDTTNLTAPTVALGSASSSVFQAVSRQLGRPAPAFQPVKVAAAELAPGMLHQDPGPVAWGHVLGSRAEHSEQGATLAYSSRDYGLLGGYEQSFDDARVGFLGGALHSHIDTEQNSSDTDSDNVFVGLYGQITQGAWQLNGSLIAGHARYDSTRRITDNLAGEETARADYHGTWLSPSLSLTRIHDLGAGLSVRPGAELNYTHGWFSGYHEKGTTNSNLDVGRRQGGVLNSRLQVAVRQELVAHQGDVELRIGVSRTDYSNEKVKIGLQGASATHYRLSGTDSVSGGYVGASARILLKNQLSLVGDLEYQRSSSSDHATVGYVGLEYRF